MRLDSGAMDGLREALAAKTPLLLDGAMGTELARRGVLERSEGNLGHGEAVRSVHRDYLEAGCGAIITNTLTMNRLFLESHGLGVDVREVNLAGARIAREAAGGRAYVLGNLSSTGQLLEPYGTCTEGQATEAFKEQAGYLLEQGVDGFIIETMIDLREAVCALKACRALTDIPVLVAIAFGTTANGGRTVMGNSARDSASSLEGEGADALGANCGSVDPREMAGIVSTLAAVTRLPIVAEPNAGKPKLVDGQTVYDMGPEEFAHGLLACREAGAAILGGCCGTTPAHIRALSVLLASWPPGPGRAAPA